jgi:DNA polymerase III sliding clamp (beta) subunit (PCNA family)
MNQITLPVSEVKTAFAGLSKIINRGAAIPALRSVRFTRTPEGQVSMACANLEGMAVYCLPNPEPGPVLDLLAEYEQINNTLKKSSGTDSLTIRMESDQKVVLGSQLREIRIEEVLNTAPIEDWPQLGFTPKQTFELGSEFKGAFAEAIQCASEDESRLILNGVFLDVRDPKKHDLVGTNGRQLYSANSFNFPLKESLIIPKHSFLEWSKFQMDGEWKLAVNQGKENTWFELSSRHWRYLAKSIEGQYPNWKQVLPNPSDKVTTIQLTADLCSHLKAIVSRLPGKKDGAVTLVVNDHFLVFAEDDQTKAQAAVPIPGAIVKGRPITVSLNRIYFGNALAINPTEIEIHDELTPVVFRNQGKTMAIAAMRGSGPKATEPKQEIQTPPEPETKPNIQMQNPIIKPIQIAEEKPATVQSLISQVDEVRNTLKTVFQQLHKTVQMLKEMEREKKSNEKEFESVRSTLRSLQKVTL